MKKIYRVSIALMLSFFMFALSGCTEKAYLSQYKAIKSSSQGYLTVSNPEYLMYWDGSNNSIYLKDKISGLAWSTIPEDTSNTQDISIIRKVNPKTQSAIFVTYYDTEKYIQDTLSSSTDAVKHGKVFAKQTSDDTISVIYDFSEAEITIVVEYTLTSKGLRISIDPNRISEGKKKIVTNVSIAPFICAVNNDSKNSYIFIPSGSGALIQPKIKTNSPSVISEEVYGEDLAVNRKFKTTTTTDIKIPVYGGISNGKGIMAIIEKGASSCNIVSNSGNESLNYTTIYADFQVRGFELVDQPNGVQASSKQRVAKVYSNPCSTKCNVLFIPLQGTGISYVTMAQEYRSYLISKYGVKAKTADEALSVRILGGIMSTEFRFGIPMSALKPLTTIDQAGKIIDELESISKNRIVYNLDGFGESGLDVGKIAGGYKINGRLGSIKKLMALNSECKNKNINLFMNFDLMRYNKSASGFSTFSDSAVAATQKRITKYFPSIISKNADTSYDSYKLLKRSEILKASDKLMKFLDKSSIKCVSLDTLSNKLYSDYSDEKYYCKSATDEIVSVYKSFLKEKYKLFSTSANDYAAIYSDYIDNVPVSSSNFDAFDVDVPFYQIAFSGLVPMYSSNWGSTGNDIDLVLRSVESGIGISMSVMAEYNTEILSSPQKSMYSCGIDNIKSRFKELEKIEYFDYYDSIKNAKIIDHILINNYVRKTIFDNGIEIFVNYSDSKFTDNEIVIDAKSFILRGVDK